MSLSRQNFSIILSFYIVGSLICLSNGYFSQTSSSSLKTVTTEAVTNIADLGKSCFCELKGSINDCSCSIDTVDHFNNVKIYPRLKSLLVKDYFRFYKANLKQECPFWADDSKCAMRFCHVESCAENEIPEGLKGHYDKENPSYKYSSQAQNDDCDYDFIKELSFLNTTISERAHEDFRRWADHDAAEDDFCILDDQHNGAEYVDLLLNPERYTGYKGESAHKIWRSIYLENCFRINNDTNKMISNYIPHLEMMNVCMEQRAFYRLISGLHTSINIHLCSKYLLSESKDFLDPKGIWGPNINEFKRRFHPETTNNQGPHWLKNLYFIYLVELRALAKAAPYLKHEEYYTGNSEEDHEVKMAIKDLLNVIVGFPNHFDESQMFSSGLASIKLKVNFVRNFAIFQE